MALNNSDFQRLLTTNDRELVNELTKKNKNKSSGSGGDKGKGKGKSSKGDGESGRKVNKYKMRALAEKEKAANKPVDDYMDRAKQRREMAGEYEKVAAEWENHGEVSVEQSKYLGGDVDHTHLVKGLDFALLNKVRTEISKQQKVDEYMKAKAERKATGGKKVRQFDNVVAKNVWSVIVDTLHPHHGTFKERVQKMGKAIALGQRIRGAPSLFLPGRMSYEFDTNVARDKSDIPRIVYASKEDAPNADLSRRPSGILNSSIVKVKTAIQRALEAKKERKLQKAQGTTSLGSEASYRAVAQKVVPKHKAKDLNDDIFSGAGVFDVGEVVRKARADQAAKKAGSGKEPDAPIASKGSYFDDAGASKYTTAPEGQLELDELQIEEQDLSGEGLEFVKWTGEFQASDKFKGARKGWAFKLGDQGLGYYQQIVPKKEKKGDEAEGTARDPRKKRKVAKGGPEGMGGAVATAYDELFPDAGMGGALVTTGDGDSDEEDGQKKKGITIGKGKGKGGGDEDSMASNRKMQGDGKKRLNENQQWQKIDSMIKKGTVGSIESMEGEARGGKRAARPRELG
eukprot:TRINITY_DN65419_c0_g1_i1.p1 TRINITY_DN65419_c0_g1~~TRINITY_DN65419_c0_g1_i1.p1  ORF type:complete len:570 (-),score=175.24 TRINITY_DN65419_c0_g1_i1:129-1838(-)